MQQKQFVFLDTAGKRWPRFRLITLISCIALFSAFIVFINDLLVVPRLKQPAATSDVDELRALVKKDENIHTPPPPPSWLIKNLQPNHRHRPGKGEPVRLAFYVDWDPESFNSLLRNYHRITHVSPDWFSFTDSSGVIGGTPSTKLLEFAKTHPLLIVPTLTNLSFDTWYPEAVENLALATADKQAVFFERVILKLKEAQASGVMLDWEEVDPWYRDKVTALITAFSETLHRHNLELWVAIPVGEDLNLFDLDNLSPVVDRFVALLFDENGNPSEPGPIASRDWYTTWLPLLLEHGDPSQWIAGLGAFGYDWVEGQAGKTISFYDAMARAEAGRSPIDTDPPFFEPHFYYAEEGVSHSVWFLDAVTFYNQNHLAESLGVGGIAVNRLGLEDQSVWELLRKLHPATRPQVEKIRPLDEMADIGDGEFIWMSNESERGHREIKVDQEERWEESYVKYPKTPTIHHRGAVNADYIALTFDDGPDPQWTPRVLDILREKGVKATFFVVGANAARYPGLVQRIVSEGHTIGNHTYFHPNLSEITYERLLLELNATQRAVESIVGNSTLLFRPPYNADSRPETLEEALPLMTTQQLGYINVMESVDTEDWQPDVTADEIVDRIRERRREGNIVLMHDAGGDRLPTIEALPRVIDYLRNRGDQIVSLPELLGVSPAAVMPPLSQEQLTAQLYIARTGFAVIRFTERFAWAFMIVATILVALRTLLIVVLSVFYRPRSSQRETDLPVSVIIAAYNEATVIRSTLTSVLKSDYPGSIEVIVVDDGSQDSTAEIVGEIAVADPRVTLIRQANAGKARALQTALAAASHELLVTLDADTQFEPRTIAELIASLLDGNTGAVSGHVKVGNRRTLFSRFQSLEYTCGFNLDRRAYDVWNCVTVVPGAVCSLKKSVIEQAGGISSDTLAEDTDLTLQIHRLGYRVGYNSRAVAWTEAPETFRSLARQRTRWAFGTIQCMWKHRDLVFHPRYGALAFFSLPSVWFFHLFLVALVPVADLFLVISLISGNGGAIVGYTLAFLATDLVLAVVASIIEREPLRRALYILPMRILYRPVLSWAVWCSIHRVLRGAWVGWDKQERKGSVLLRSVRALTHQAKEAT